MKPESEWREPTSDGLGWSSYTHMMEDTGLEFVVKHSMGDYQGDSVALVRDGKWGFLSWGWGSCAGCDALQACKSPDDYKGLRKEMYDSIHWEADPTAMADWLLGRDWEGQWYGSQSEFVLQATAALNPEWKFSPTSLLLLSNEECPPEIAADSAGEDGYGRIAAGLRDAHTKWSAKSLLLKELKRVGLVANDVVEASNG